MKRIRKAVIPAAGFGTRFLPATKATPKEMLPIVDKPTIQYIVEEAISSGIEDILIISGHAKRAIEDHFDSAPILEAELKAKGKTKLLEMVQETSEINVHYIRQKHMRGLGDAILCARAFIDNEPFAVLLGDDIVYNPEMPALKQLMDMYTQTGATILGCQQVPKEKVSSYGIVAGVPTINEQLMKVNDMIEKLFAINCKYNFKIEPDGKCYSKECMMNTDSELKEKIKNNGCKCFNQFKEEHK